MIRRGELINDEREITQTNHKDTMRKRIDEFSPFYALSCLGGKF